jgi:hypothetical protein
VESRSGAASGTSCTATATTVTGRAGPVPARRRQSPAKVGDERRDEQDEEERRVALVGRPRIARDERRVVRPREAGRGRDQHEHREPWEERGPAQGSAGGGGAAFYGLLFGFAARAGFEVTAAGCAVVSASSAVVVSCGDSSGSSDW